MSWKEALLLLEKALGYSDKDIQVHLAVDEALSVIRAALCEQDGRSDGGAGSGGQVCHNR